MIKIVTSKDNEIIKAVKRLKQKKYRKEQKAFLLEGIKLVKEGVNNACTFLKVFTTEGFYEANKEFINNLNCDIIITKPFILDSLSTTNLKAEIIAYCKQNLAELKHITSNFLVLEHIQDPGNLGAILRSAAGAGFKQVLMIDCVDVYNDKVIRSSMGNFLKLSLTSVNYEKLEVLLKNTPNYTLYLADMKGENVFEISKKSGKIGLIIGNEGSGVTKKIAKLSNKTISIPMKNNVESLNAAVSASILMYELTK